MATYRLIDGTSGVDKIIDADDMADAKEQAESWMRDVDWIADAEEGATTTWVDVMIEDRTNAKLFDYAGYVKQGIVGPDASPECHKCGEVIPWGSRAYSNGISTTTEGDYLCQDCESVPSETLTITIEPDEPQCSHDDGHVWEETGVRGNGGGVICTDICAHCGTRRVTDTWAQRRDTGEQGLASTKYLAARPDFAEVE